MSSIRYFEDDKLGTIRVAKHRNSRSLRLSITPKGEIRVTIPVWAPYKSGIDFARSKSGWITLHKPKTAAPLENGYRIGKAHRLKFDTGAIDVPVSRIAASDIRITRPLGMAISHPKVQTVAQRAAIRALRSQAESLLPKRLQQLAEAFGFDYGNVSVKQLRGRWGSCDNQKNIVLNLFLMQLPWELIDYVLIHELVHTKHLNHGEDFWAEFARHEPRCKSLRKQVHGHRPVLIADPPQSMA